MGSEINPFPESDEARHQIWEALVRRDIEAFVAADWSRHAPDFLDDGFIGVDASEPGSWTVRFPTLQSYAEHWQRAAEEAARTEWGEDLAAAHFRVSTLERISVEGARALAQKVFDGTVLKADRSHASMRWQTNYMLRRIGRNWRISGFIGYLDFRS